MRRAPELVIMDFLSLLREDSQTIPQTRNWRYETFREDPGKIIVLNYAEKLSESKQSTKKFFSSSFLLSCKLIKWKVGDERSLLIVGNALTHKYNSLPGMNGEQAVSIRIISILQNCNTLVPVGLTVSFLVIGRGLVLLNNVRRLLDSFLFLRWEIKVIWRSGQRLLHCLLYLQDLIEHITNKKTIKHIWTVTSLQLSLQEEKFDIYVRQSEWLPSEPERISLDLPAPSDHSLGSGQLASHGPAEGGLVDCLSGRGRSPVRVITKILSDKI